MFPILVAGRNVDLPAWFIVRRGLLDLLSPAYSPEFVRQIAEGQTHIHDETTLRNAARVEP